MQSGWVTNQMKTGLLLLARRDYQINGRRNRLTILAVGISVFLVSSVLALSESFYAKMLDEMKVSDANVLTIAFGSGTNPLNYTYQSLYTERDISLVRQVKDVSNVTGVKGVGIESLVYGDSKRILASTLKGVSADFFTNFNIGYSGSFPNTDEEVLIGASVASASDLKIGDRLVATVKGEKRELRVSGILDRQGEQLFSTFPVEVNQLVATNVSNPLFAGSDYMYLSAIANDTSRLSEISAEIEGKLVEDDDLTAALQNTGLRPLVATRQNVLDMLGTWFGYISLFIYAVAALIGIICTINIVNIFVITIQEKYRDIAIYKVVGASRRQIKTIYVIQSIAIGLLGTVFGLICGIGLSKAAEHALGWVGHLSFLSISLSLLIGIGSPVIAGLAASAKTDNVSINILSGGQ